MNRSSHHLSYGTLLAIALLIGLFVICLRSPLSHTDLWGHLAYGRVIAEEGRFPSTEPFLKLSLDVPFVTTAWLSQWIGFQIHQASGPFGLQLVYAMLCTGCFATIYWLVVRESAEPWIGILAMLIFGALEYQQLIIVRPQLAGMLCFCLLLLVMHQSAKRYLAVGVLMMLWANLHGSFVIGPVVIGMIGAGELLDRFRKINVEESRSPQSIVRETALLLAIALIAGLINPYGIELYREVLMFSGSPNLYSLIEWKPLWSTPKQGTAFTVALGFGSLIVAFSKHAFRWRAWVPVLVLTVLTFKTSRYIVWFAPVYVLAIGPYLKSLLEAVVSRSKRCHQFVALTHRETTAGRPLILLLIAIAVFVLSLSRFSAYSSGTPIAATERLLELPRQTLILNSMEWGDWMIWRSRAALPVFVNSHVTLIPPELWRDYMTLIKLEPGWESILVKYPFTAAVLQTGRQRRLVAKLEQNPAWREIYRDDIAAIFLRVDTK